MAHESSPILSNSPPTEYLNEADLFEFPLIRATNLYTDEGYAHQSDMTNDEGSSGPSRSPTNLNEVAGLRPSYFFHRDDYSDPSSALLTLGRSSSGYERYRRITPDLPTSSTNRNQIGNEGLRVSRDEISDYGHFSPLCSVEWGDDDYNGDEESTFGQLIGSTIIILHHRSSVPLVRNDRSLSRQSL
ncbi:hypothetical protein DID88_008616 [Monilinia fructigena]|uniref:Uncharacterized protein n=1 Tax=Monilinia fructigena TaxID=38457 RepID=A0A395J6C3_9HELO|nr:hypothetical protein DID88_008616 [Monilinia fructigena]